MFKMLHKLFVPEYALFEQTSKADAAWKDAHRGLLRSKWFWIYELIVVIFCCFMYFVVFQFLPKSVLTPIILVTSVSTLCYLGFLTLFRSYMQRSIRNSLNAQGKVLLCVECGYIIHDRTQNKCSECGRQLVKVSNVQEQETTRCKPPVSTD